MRLLHYSYKNAIIVSFDVFDIMKKGVAYPFNVKAKYLGAAKLSMKEIGNYHVATGGVEVIHLTPHPAQTKTAVTKVVTRRPEAVVCSCNAGFWSILFNAVHGSERDELITLNLIAVRNS